MELTKKIIHFLLFSFLIVRLNIVRSIENVNAPRFDLIGAIDIMSIHNFTFPFWDPIHDNYRISRTVDLTGEDLIIVARDICEEYTTGELSDIDDTAMLRCLSPTLMTLRKTKVHGISLLSRMFEKYPFDEEIYGLLVGYEGLYRSQPDSDESEVDSNEKRVDAREDMIFHVNKDGSLSPFHRFGEGKDNPSRSRDEGLTTCVIGVPTAHTILPALFTKPISQVVVYSSIFDDEEDGELHETITKCDAANVNEDIQRLRTNSQYATWNYFYANEAAMHLGKSLEYRSMRDLLTAMQKSNTDTDTDNEEIVESPQCDVIQLNVDHECEPLFINKDFFTQSLRFLTDLPPSSSHFDSHKDRQTMIFQLQQITHISNNGTQLTNFHDLSNESASLLWSTLEQDGLLTTDLIQAQYANDLIFVEDVWGPPNEVLKRTTDDLKNEIFQVNTIYVDFEGSWYRFDLNYEELREVLSVVCIGRYVGYRHQQQTCKEKDEVDRSAVSLRLSSRSDDIDSSDIKHFQNNERFNFPSDRNKNILTFVITWSIHIFIESAFGLAQTLAASLDDIERELQLIGVDVDIEIYMAAEMSTSVYQYLQEQSDMVIHIPVSTVDEITHFTKHSVLYNSEQVSFKTVFSQRGLMRYKYMFYQHNTMLWSYDQVSMEHFRDHVFKEMHDSESDRAELESRIAVVPYLYRVERQEVLRKLFYTNNSESLRGYAMPLTRIQDSYVILEEIPFRIHNWIPLDQYLLNDNKTRRISNHEELRIKEQEILSHQNHKVIIFLGACTDRRVEMIIQLESTFFTSYLKKRVSSDIKFYSICRRVFYYHYDYYIMKAKVIVNIASSNTSIFETHRINHLLSLGKVIVSEMGANTSIAERYADGVILIPNAEDPKNISVLLKAIDSMIHNETAMEMQSKKAQALYKETILRRDRWQMIKGMIKTVLALLHF